MSQFARPSTDEANPGSYVNQVGSGTNIFQAIDEAAADDADYIRSPNNPSNAIYVTKLTSVDDPGVDVGHAVKVRAKKDLVNPAQVDLTVQLREGYTNEGSQGTLIATLSIVDLTTSFVLYTLTLSEAEAGNITDYTDLFLRFISNAP